MIHSASRRVPGAVVHHVPASARSSSPTSADAVPRYSHRASARFAVMLFLRGARRRREAAGPRPRAPVLALSWGAWRAWRPDGLTERGAFGRAPALMGASPPPRAWRPDGYGHHGAGTGWSKTWEASSGVSSHDPWRSEGRTASLARALGWYGISLLRRRRLLEVARLDDHHPRRVDVLLERRRHLIGRQLGKLLFQIAFIGECPADRQQTAQLAGDRAVRARPTRRDAR